MSQETDRKFRKTTESNSPKKKVQINPLDVDKIVKAIVEKHNWQSKLDTLAEKWKEECYSQGISLASVEVAIEILKDIQRRGKGVKHCCGHCGANPQPENQERYDDEEEGEKEEEEEEMKYYSRSEKFCLCPCNHCALKVKTVDESICAVNDDLIPKELNERLKQNIAIFENVTEDKKDWHPGSDKQVLDLIHPSLYCYVKGVSQLNKVEEEEENPKPKIPKQSSYYLKPTTTKAECYWMPSEFSLKEDNEIEIQSYINNIDERKHKDLYDVISKIFSKFIPLFSNFVDLEEKPMRLQVIVKAANIIVTPEKSYYPGGTWHKEGTPQENIVAGGIYYYHSENVKDSYLEFRGSVSDEIDYEQDDVKGAFESSGLHDGDLLFDHLGSVETKEGRCIAFGNTDTQHRVRHFFPIDPSKPAIRKILVFFLVDPNKPIVSTKDVEPQQLGMLLSRYFILIKLIPIEILYNNVLKFLPHFTLEQAKEYRKELMEARKFYTNFENEEVFEREFSLCEH
ncbi:hypothetical protein ABK040_013699 [Willaertia magna]